MLKPIQNSSQWSGKATFNVLGVAFKINTPSVEVKLSFLEESRPFPVAPCLSQEVNLQLAEMCSHAHPEGQTGDGEEMQKWSSEDAHLPEPPLAETAGSSTDHC